MRSAAPSSLAVVSWPAPNRKVAVRTTSVTAGTVPVRVGGRSEFTQDIVAWLGTALFDVGAELLVEELQRVDGRGVAFDVSHQVRARQRVTELLVVVSRNAEKVGNRQQRERFRVRGEELTLAAVDELVELAVRELPEEVLVGLEPARASAAGSAGNAPACGWAGPSPPCARATASGCGAHRSER